jgi:hypothetical protein
MPNRTKRIEALLNSDARTAEDFCKRIQGALRYLPVNFVDIEKAIERLVAKAPSFEQYVEATKEMTLHRRGGQPLFRSRDSHRRVIKSDTHAPQCRHCEEAVAIPGSDTCKDCNPK